jgi:hypothetical protein
LGAARKAAPALRLRARFVDVQRAPAHVGAIQRRNRLIRLRSVGHLDESEPA